MSSNIGNAIQRLRHQHGIGQGELAEALGVSAQVSRERKYYSAGLARLINNAIIIKARKR